MIQKEQLRESSYLPRRELPIKPEKKSEWYKKENPNRLCREYKLKDDSYNNFVSDLLDLQTDLQHHARITLDYPLIKIELWTHDLMDITEIDKDWAKKAEQIFRGYADEDVY